MCCGWLALSDATISEQLNTDPVRKKAADFIQSGKPRGLPFRLYSLPTVSFYDAT
jgi:hypothetical protein